MSSDNGPRLAAAYHLAEDICALYGRGFEELNGDACQIAAATGLLFDAALRKRAQSRPATVEDSGVAGDLLFCKDPDYWSCVQCDGSRAEHRQ